MVREVKPRSPKRRGKGKRRGKRKRIVQWVIEGHEEDATLLAGLIESALRVALHKDHPKRGADAITKLCTAAVKFSTAVLLQDGYVVGIPSPESRRPN